MSIEGQFFLKRLHSLCGIIPLGLFLLEHLYTNSFALSGDIAFNNQVAFLHRLPYLFIFEIILIFIPLTFHMLYGVWRIYEAKNNTCRYGYLRNWLFYFQRISGIIMVAFVAYHLYSFKLMSWLNGTDITFNYIASSLNNNYVLIFYVIGILSATFHFANGLWNFGITWGITIGRKAQYYSMIVSMLIFGLLSIAELNVLFTFIQ